MLDSQVMVLQLRRPHGASVHWANIAFAAVS
jgi:hypothetical protein